MSRKKKQLLLKIAFGLSFIPVTFTYRYLFPSLDRMGTRSLEETGWGMPLPIFIWMVIGIAAAEGFLAYYAFKRA